MALFDDLAKALTGGAQGKGGEAGGLAALAQIAMQNPQLLQAAASMLTSANKHGGLAGLLQKFQQAGLGDVAQSWVAPGANRPVQPAQIEQVFGSAGMERLAQKSGTSAAQTSDLLAQVLPLLVDRLTPQGQAPAQAPASADALLGMLGGLLGKR